MANGVLVFLPIFICFAAATFFLRWLRWHFILRRYDIRLPTRKSLFAFCLALPLGTIFIPGRWTYVIVPLLPYIILLSPFFSAIFSELKNSTEMKWRKIYGLLLLDFVSICVTAFCVFKISIPILSESFAILLLGFVTFVFSAGLPVGKNRRFWDHAWTFWVLVFTNLLSIYILYIPLLFFAQAPSLFEFARSFSEINMSHYVGIPRLYANFQNRTLTNIEVDYLACLITALIISVGIILVFLKVRRKSRPQTNTPEHFDAISAQYEAEIPEHVRELLLGRKIAITNRFLNESGAAIRSPLRALDFGCGQGWYAMKFAALGYQISACDTSPGQIAMAKKNAEAEGMLVNFFVFADAKLPFADGEFDFVYTINVFHHIIDSDARQAVFAEIRRVLKPNGLFLLHDINVRNPLFRFYMSYLFPLRCIIDDGTEVWVSPQNLSKNYPGAWSPRVDYFTFFPDFIPQGLLKLVRPLEAILERTCLRIWSAHFCACMQKSK